MAVPVVPWMGGKRRLAKHILPLFPEHTCYVEAFAGGAALFYKKAPVKTEVLNDINGDIVNLYRVIQHHMEEFLRQFKWALVSRQMFDWLKLTYPDTLTDIQRAARFYYLQKLAFGARATGQTFGTAPSTPPRLNLIRMEEEISQAHLRLSRVYIERLDWKAVVKKYDRPYTLFYLDPPYLDTEGYGVDFPVEEYTEMAALAKSVQGKVIISINDHPVIREIFKGMNTEKVSVRYTVGQQATPSSELIIRNF